MSGRLRRWWRASAAVPCVPPYPWEPVDGPMTLVSTHGVELQTSPVRGLTPAAVLRVLADIDALPEVPA